MYPILFTIGGVNLYSFGLSVAVGFLISSFLLLKECRRKGVDANPILDLALGSFTSALIGARLLYVFLHQGWYRTHPLEIFQVQRGGLIAYGGILLGIFFSIVFLRLKRISFWETADVLIPFGVLTQAFGRIGCFLNGCCYGKPSSLFGIHPTQLYESFGLFLLFAGLRYADRWRLKPGRPPVRRDEPRLRAGRLFSLYLVGYGLLRFGVEFLRGDQAPFLISLTLAKWMSLASLAAGVWNWIWINTSFK